MPGSSSEIRTAAGLIRLAIGSREAEWSSLSWRDVAALAARERCIALAWLRSSETLTRHADPDVVQWWRDLALRTLARGYAHLETLSAVRSSLARAGVRCVTLKGAPLSVTLYGEPGARGSADLDVWIPLDHRDRAREMLLETGWRHADGGAPNDEAFDRPSPHGVEYLEIHSRLLHSRFDYLPLPDPEWTEARVAGASLSVMTGSLLPAYLAVQIAKHQFAPVLWLVDHRTLWARLDGDARELARWTARRCGVDRYLEWALRRTTMLERVVEGDPSAVARLGLQVERRTVHPMWRHVQLAPSLGSRLRALRAWLAPPWETSVGVGPMGFMRRLRRYWRAAIVTRASPRSQANAAGISARDITVSGEHMLRVVRDVCLVGGRMWINTTGTSMYPTLLDSDRVLLERATRVEVGDVVLVDAGGVPLLHRIVRARGGLITTRGDARMTSDTTLRRGDVLARAVRVRRGELEWSLTPTRWRRLRLRAAHAGATTLTLRGSRAHV